MGAWVVTVLGHTAENRVTENRILRVPLLVKSVATACEQRTKVCPQPLTRGHADLSCVARRLATRTPSRACDCVLWS